MPGIMPEVAHLGAPEISLEVVVMKIIVMPMKGSRVIIDWPIA